MQVEQHKRQKILENEQKHFQLSRVHDTHNNHYSSIVLSSRSVPTNLTVVVAAVTVVVVINVYISHKYTITTTTDLSTGYLTSVPFEPTTVTTTTVVQSTSASHSHDDSVSYSSCGNTISEKQKQQPASRLFSHITFISIIFFGASTCLPCYAAAQSVIPSVFSIL